MADLANVWNFYDNPDAYAAFLHRVEAAVVEKAVALREEAEPSPVTHDWRARQEWATSVLGGPHHVAAAAKAMLPALAVKANAAGLLSDTGVITATDNQIRATLDDDFVDLHAGYVPAAG
jgi:hypothetical protein